MARRPTSARTAAEQDRQSEIDRHVGRRIRLRRMLLGTTQTQLASMVGVSFQQLHLYERGQNGVPASRLYDLARALAVPVGFFFSDFGDAGGRTAPGSSAEASPAGSTPGGGLHDDGRSQRDIRAVIRLFRRIENPAERRKILDWMDQLGSNPNAEPPRRA